MRRQPPSGTRSRRSSAPGWCSQLSSSARPRSCSAEAGGRSRTCCPGWGCAPTRSQPSPRWSCGTRGGRRRRGRRCRSAAGRHARASRSGHQLGAGGRPAHRVRRAARDRAGGSLRRGRGVEQRPPGHLVAARRGRATGAVGGHAPGRDRGDYGRGARHRHSLGDPPARSPSCSRCSSRRRSHLVYRGQARLPPAFGNQAVPRGGRPDLRQRRRLGRQRRPEPWAAAPPTCGPPGCSPRDPHGVQRPRSATASEPALRTSTTSGRRRTSSSRWCPAFPVEATAPDPAR